MQVHAVVGFGKKAAVAVYPPLNDMKGHPGHHESSFARHALSNGTSITTVDVQMRKIGSVPIYRRSTHHMSITAVRKNAALGTEAAAMGGQFCSRPTCEKRLFSMWKKMPSMMPRNTFTPTIPARACMYANGSASAIITIVASG